MPHRPGKIIRKSIGVSVFMSTISASAWAQKSIHCPDGDHVLIDLKQVAIQYDASSFAGTLSSLSVLSGRLEVAPKKLQDAAAATQQWNEFLKGLVNGYNSCAVSRQQYADGLNRIYPRLKQDAANLDAIRKLITEGQKADTKRLQTLLDSFWSNLREFAQVSGNEIVLKRIEALSEQVASGHGQILEKEDLILAKLNELQQRNAQAPVPTPQEISQEIFEVRKELLAQADAAEQAYAKAYELLNQYRFREAIVHLQRALAIIQLPDFYLTLGRAYWELPDLPRAESTLQNGLEVVAGKNDDKHEASLASMLSLTLLDKGDLEGALSYAQRALRIDEKVYGPEHSTIARDASNIGAILKDKGDLDGALSYAQRALRIDEKVYGPDHPRVAIRANNIGMVLQDKGNLDAALSYVRRALNIDEKVYGPDDPRVAIRANNIGAILKDKGDPDAALSYAQRALQIDQKVYGPDHPIVARDVSNIGTILQDKGDLEGALGYAHRALEIDEKVYGPDHPTVAMRANNIGTILREKWDLEGALSYMQRALKIYEKVYGPDHPMVAICASNISVILKDKRDLDGALSYALRALRIDEKLHGLDHPRVATDASNIGTILQDKGDLEGALGYAHRALKIDETVYGPDHPMVAICANNIGMILKDKGDLDGALNYVQRALKILIDHYGPNNPKTMSIAANLKKIEQAKEAQQH